MKRKNIQKNRKLSLAKLFKPLKPYIKSPKHTKKQVESDDKRNPNPYQELFGQSIRRYTAKAVSKLLGRVL